jgi:lysine-N-methylase
MIKGKLRPILQPYYMKRFQCIGSSCEDCCCEGWRVTLDQATYHKYRKCSDINLQSKLQKQVTRIRTNASEYNYAKIRLTEEDICPFLDEKRLCSIQRKLGEKYLSITCTAYPRITNLVGETMERSLTLSCPEAARLILLNPSLMEFDGDEEDSSIRNAIAYTINSNDFHMLQQPGKYFWDMRIFIITLLQERSYPLWQRIIILGFFCQKLTELARQGKSHDIPETIGLYTRRIQTGAYCEALKTVSNNTVIQMELLSILTNYRLESGMKSRRFLDCFNDFSRGIGYLAKDDEESLAQRYEEAAVKYYQTFMDQHAYIMENYLVNYVFKELFPVQGQKHIFDNYVLLVVHFSLIKMLLTGMAAFYKNEFSIDHVIKVFQSFSKEIEHNKAYLVAVIEFLEKNQLNTMPYMAALIKN